MTDILTIGRLAILYVALSVLIRDPKTLRQHSARQIRQLALSIKAFGFVVPILVDCHNRIVAGVGRFLAAQLLGMDVVPVIRLEHLTEAQTKAFRIADSRLTELASWNDRLLAETLKELSELELDFSLEATGFTMGEIDLRIEGLSATGNDAPDPADQLPTPNSQIAISKLGDLWRMGRHAVFCGSALLAGSFHALLGIKRTHMVFTDPPFNIRIQGNTSGHGRIQYRDFAMAVGELDMVEFTSFLIRCCALMAKYSIDGSMHFICMDWRHLGELLEAGRLAYAELKNICVWDKGSGGLGSFYRSEHEFVLVFKHGSAPHRNNLQLGQYPPDLWLGQPKQHLLAGRTLMSLPQTDYFDTHLPGVSQSVRIASFYDAKVFACWWTIRDKDPALKALLRHMEQARSSATADSAIWQLKQALASRGLLVMTSP